VRGPQVSAISSRWRCLINPEAPLVLLESKPFMGWLKRSDGWEWAKTPSRCSVCHVHVLALAFSVKRA
jgi:hypothetical protein